MKKLYKYIINNFKDPEVIIVLVIVALFVLEIILAIVIIAANTF